MNENGWNISSFRLCSDFTSTSMKSDRSVPLKALSCPMDDSIHAHSRSCYHSSLVWSFVIIFPNIYALLNCLFSHLNSSPMQMRSIDTISKWEKLSFLSNAYASQCSKIARQSFYSMFLNVYHGLTIQINIVWIFAENSTVQNVVVTLPHDVHFFHPSESRHFFLLLEVAIGCQPVSIAWNGMERVSQL